MKSEATVLILVDVQQKLMRVMHCREALIEHLERLVRGCLALRVPVIRTEQVPEKMGDTIPELKALLKADAPISKSSFSCCGEPAFTDALGRRGARHALLAGIEAHVCVQQTAADLVRAGFTVDVIADATSSRTAENRAIGLDRARASGAGITSVETALFELLETAAHPAFREILKIVK